MTENIQTEQNTDTEVETEEKRTYQPPSLVRYGPLFFNTQAKTCSEAAASVDVEGDKCDPPDGDKIVDEADLAKGEGKGGSDSDHDHSTQVDGTK